MNHPDDRKMGQSRPPSCSGSLVVRDLTPLILLVYSLAHLNVKVQWNAISLFLVVMLDPPSPCSVVVEDTFGPFVNASCRHGFDFTLLFEELILTLLPLVIILLILPLRAWRLKRASDKVNRSWLCVAKEVG